LNILITGASRGIGFGLVQQYAAAHAQNQVFAGVRSVSTAIELTSFSQQHPNVHIIPLDVSETESVLASVSHVKRSGVDHIDLIINNAAVWGVSDPLKATAADLVETYTTNVVGPLLVVQSYLSLLQKSTQAKVINVSSFVGSNAHITTIPQVATSYGTSKAALNYLNTLLAHSFPQILFLSISPGWVDTDMGNGTGGKPPTTIKDSVSGIRYYIEQKNATQNQGEFLDIMTGKSIPF
jgi:NAD(P)-dependent dehydrogenase (short-subunit alcohol dehydrogenase family)